ncbi:hypothetical protein B0H13DRAFT_2320104 [Mycena leptocephala]|nr:hypothetical protein B0H13DRAFT_2320104 [Mycena leptocephala]
MTGKKRKHTVFVNPPGGDMLIASTATNRRVREEQTLAPPRSPEKRAFDNFDHLMGYENNEDGFMQVPVREGPVAIKIKVKHYMNSDHPVKAWIPERDKFLDGLMQQEGRGPWWTKGCTDCHEPNPTWRCEDCFGGRMLCLPCITERHRDKPLHLLEEWEDDYFQARSLRDLGLQYQDIGHRPGERCPFVHLSPQVKGFVVLHDNGIHTLDVDFCSCPGAPKEVQQLLSVGWYPATQEEPVTATSLSLLHRFHLLNLQAKVAAYDFYNILALLRNGSGLHKPPNRLPQFMHMVHESHHLQMCKCAGRGHHALGIAGTKTGDLAIPCCACPQPGINLPEGWEDALPEMDLSLMLSKDANFKLKGRDRSSREKDPTLGPGWAYMVANDDYLRHLSKSVAKDEISQCVSFAALWSRTTNGQRVEGDGLGSVSCSHYEMFRPVGTGDLQAGERYGNMDYLFFSSVMGFMLLAIIASYDMHASGVAISGFGEENPVHMQLPDWVQIQFKVPKFHLPPHVKKCHGPYSFNYTKGVAGQTGKGWSVLATTHSTTSAAGEIGERRWIWETRCSQAGSRIPNALIHSRAFAAFTEGLREGHEEELLEWEQTVRAWEADNEKPNPYEYPEVEAETMADVMLRIPEEEHARVEQNRVAALLVKPAAFLMAGIAIEEEQAAVALEAKRKTRTTIQATALQRQRTILLGKVSALRDVQETYMPGLRQWAGQQNPPLPATDNSKPETINIYLPSALPIAAPVSVCVPGLAKHEDDLQSAQAVEALRELWSGLQTRTFAHQFKRKLTASQGVYTKSRTLMDGIKDRIRTATACYRAARAALMGLRGPGDWESVLQVLEKADIQGINERSINEEEKEENRKAQLLAGLGKDGDADDLDTYGEPMDLTVLFNLETGEGHRHLSWIWYMAPGAKDQTAAGKLHDVEWMKARARVARWREEVILLEEEMQRVLEFCTWKAQWWRKRVTPVRPDSRGTICPQLAEGLRAYAREQAHWEESWAATWERKWAPVRPHADLVVRDHLLDITEDLLVPLEVELDDEDTERDQYGPVEEEEEE